MDKAVDKSILLQKQVCDNAADLTAEYLGMKHWEEQIKKVEEELMNSSGADGPSQLLPPVREKKKSLRTKLKSRENGSKVKRIKSYDYKAWDSFDADKVCEELEKENEFEDSSEEILSKEELEKNHENATKYKVAGNVFVQQQKWDKAMVCYNEAIKIFPYDAIFFANRALCHLKMDNLYSAAADCTTALQQDENYVKAYHRRATVRMALKQYKEAVQDLKHLLTLEPMNKEAKKMFAIATKQVEKSNSIIINSNKITEEKMSVSENQVQEFKKIVSEEPSKNIEKNMQREINRAEIVLPDWLPVQEKNIDVIEPIEKPLHRRSKMSMKKISVTSGDLTAPISQVLQSPTPLATTIPRVKSEELQKIDFVVENEKNEKDKKNIEIPPIPKSSVQFFLTWRGCNSPKFRFEYLQQLPPESIPKVFQDSMESNIFSEIVSTLKTEFIPRKAKVFYYLKYLSEIKRFSTLIMFLSKKEKEDLNVLFDFCHAVEGLADTTIKKIRLNGGWFLYFQPVKSYTALS